MVFRTLVVFALLCAAWTSLSAGDFAVFGPQVGFFRSGSANESRIMGGLALRLNLSDRLGIQSSLSYRQESTLTEGVRTRSWPILLSGLFYPSEYIFGAVGMGWYRTSVDVVVQPADPAGTPLLLTETQTQTGWHVGAGMEVPLGMGTKISADVKYVFLNYSFQSIPGNTNVNGDFFVTTVGLLFGL